MTTDNNNKKQTVKKMKKTKTKTMTAALVAFTVLFLASCTHNKDKNAEQQQTARAGYNYDSIVDADYKSVADTYGLFRFLEADAEFDDLLSENPNPTVNYIRTVFQHGDTCVIIEHPKNAYGAPPVTTKTHGHWLGCADMSDRRNISLDSCLSIIAPMASGLPTRHLTFRRIEGPPFPVHAEYIFGHGLLFVDCQSGAVRDYRSQEAKGRMYPH